MTTRPVIELSHRCPRRAVVSPSSPVKKLEEAAVRTVLVVAAIAGAVHVSLAGEVPRSTHTRPLSPGAAVLLADAAAASSIVRAQIEALEWTDLIVYVTDLYDTAGGAPAACLNWISAAGGRRYVLIRVAGRQGLPHERIVWLGHELQHALEVAAAPGVQDEAGLERLYRRIGWEQSTGRFETDAAQEAGELIRNELAGFAPRVEDDLKALRLTAALAAVLRPRPPEAA